MVAWIFGITLPLIYIVGVYSSVDAMMRSRHAQSTTAWILGLTFIPFITLPLYWTLGRRGYADYVDAQSRFDEKTAQQQEAQRQYIADRCQLEIGDETDLSSRAEMTAFERFGDGPFTRHNQMTLLINGHNTFESIFEAIDAAKTYILVQFYIIHDDDTGRRLHQKLVDARERDVAVYLLYDEIGCLSLTDNYLSTIRDAGVVTAAFSGGRRSFQKFRLNFRNHRKIVVVDGHVSFVGGHNVGDEYLGRDDGIGYWRDTHVRVEGPATLGLQLSFLRDWYFATAKVPEEISIEPHCTSQDASVQIASSGPHDAIENCGLLFAHLILSAERRLWIATPYLVPDGRVLGALQLAAMRGVDVRVLVPRSSDSVLFKYVPFAFIDDIMRAGCRTYFYEKGFMHQKIILVDDDYGVVSTANFDNRSFHLNFEVSCIVRDEKFCAETEAMLEKDFANATEITLEDVNSRPFMQRLATQATRLLAPIL